MSEEVKKYHEEDAIGKTYDWRVARRLAGYLRPYWKTVAAALTLTLLTNILVSTQPYFKKVAVDDFITPKRVDGIWLFALAFLGVFLLRFVFSYTQEVLLNHVGRAGDVYLGRLNQLRRSSASDDRRRGSRTISA